MIQVTQLVISNFGRKCQLSPKFYHMSMILKKIWCKFIRLRWISLCCNTGSNNWTSFFQSRFNGTFPHFSVPLNIFLSVFLRPARSSELELTWCRSNLFLTSAFKTITFVMYHFNTSPLSFISTHVDFNIGEQCLFLHFLLLKNFLLV